MNPEREVEIKLWDWLKNRDHGNVIDVFFNSKNEVSAKIFKVRGGCKKLPDLVLKFSNPYTGAINYMAIEVKDASKTGGNVRKGTKIYSEYLLNYIRGKTKYYIGKEEIVIDHFALATQFSEEGHLVGNEVPITTEGVRGKTNIIGKVCFLTEFTTSKEIVRGMMHSFSKYREDKKLRKIKLPSIGIMVSDILNKFTRKELELQKGMIGLPIYQAITYNEIRKEWRQCLMKL